jgi:hypothetical protein
VAHGAASRIRAVMAPLGADVMAPPVGRRGDGAARRRVMAPLGAV